MNGGCQSHPDNRLCRHKCGDVHVRYLHNTQNQEQRRDPCSRFRMHADQVKLVIRQPAVLRVDDRDDSVFTDIVKHRTLHGEINDIRAVF